MSGRMMSNAKPAPTISATLTTHIEQGNFPSAVYLVAEHGEVMFADALGYAVREPEQIPATLNTIYDLASLTKPLITGLLCARRIELGELTLDSAVLHYLPEFDRTDKQMITVRELLTHTSGLPAWKPLGAIAPPTRDAIVAAISDAQLEYTPGTRVVYSDLGFITLGFLLERMTHSGFADLAQREIIAPLGLVETGFNPDAGHRNRIAASETGNAYEREQSLSLSASAQLVTPNTWRDAVIWAEVHDGNAYFLGGAAGHAGLFSTARETMFLAEQFIAGRTKLLKPETCTHFRTNMTEGLNEARSIGWQLALTKDSSAGPALPGDSFGHTGFTGTSCWVDASKERVLILLTNRTHAHSLPFANLSAVRREFHSLAIEALDQNDC